jgi:N-acetylglucosamine malate deacetylase 1
VICRHIFLLLFVLCVVSLPTAAARAEEKLRIIAFGAHPDDCELRAAGVAARWAKAGHAVKFVSLTNGDAGHFVMSGGPLAERRKAEVEECARVLGIETEVLDIPDGELMPTLENRKKVARLIREWQADVVLFHRPYDYHADHRYTGVLVEDSAVLVVAPFFTPETPAVKKNPIFLHFYDPFTKPVPFKPSIVVGIDEVAEQKWKCIESMPSQFADEDSWQARYLPGVPKDDKARAEFLLDRVKQRSADLADKYREELAEHYGEEKAAKIRYAEAFEVCQYGTQPTAEELRALFLVE